MQTNSGLRVLRTTNEEYVIHTPICVRKIHLNISLPDKIKQLKHEQHDFSHFIVMYLLLLSLLSLLLLLLLSLLSLNPEDNTSDSTSSYT